MGRSRVKQLKLNQECMGKFVKMGVELCMKLYPYHFPTSHIRLQMSHPVLASQIQIFLIMTMSKKSTVQRVKQQEPVDNVPALQFPVPLNTSPPLNKVDPLADSSSLGLTRSPKGFWKR